MSRGEIHIEYNELMGDRMVRQHHSFEYSNCHERNKNKVPSSTSIKKNQTCQTQKFNAPKTHNHNYLDLFDCLKHWQFYIGIAIAIVCSILLFILLLGFSCKDEMQMINSTTIKGSRSLGNLINIEATIKAKLKCNELIVDFSLKTDSEGCVFSGCEGSQSILSPSEGELISTEQKKNAAVINYLHWKILKRMSCNQKWDKKLDSLDFNFGVHISMEDFLKNASFVSLKLMAFTSYDILKDKKFDPKDFKSNFVQLNPLTDLFHSSTLKIKSLEGEKNEIMIIQMNKNNSCSTLENLLSFFSSPYACAYNQNIKRCTHFTREITSEDTKTKMNYIVTIFLCH